LITCCKMQKLKSCLKSTYEAGAVKVCCFCRSYYWYSSVVGQELLFFVVCWLSVVSGRTSEYVSMAYASQHNCGSNANGLWDNFAVTAATMTEKFFLYRTVIHIGKTTNILQILIYYCSQHNKPFPSSLPPYRFNLLLYFCPYSTFNRFFRSRWSRPPHDTTDEKIIFCCDLFVNHLTYSLFIVTNLNFAK